MSEEIIQIGAYRGSLETWEALCKVTPVETISTIVSAKTAGGSGVKKVRLPAIHAVLASGGSCDTKIDGDKLVLSNVKDSEGKTVEISKKEYNGAKEAYNAYVAGKFTSSGFGRKYYTPEGTKDSWSDVLVAHAVENPEVMEVLA